MIDDKIVEIMEEIEELELDIEELEEYGDLEYRFWLTQKLVVLEDKLSKARMRKNC